MKQKGIAFIFVILLCCFLFDFTSEGWSNSFLLVGLGYLLRSFLYDMYYIGIFDGLIFVFQRKKESFYSFQSRDKKRRECCGYAVFFVFILLAILLAF